MAGEQVSTAQQDGHGAVSTGTAILLGAGQGCLQHDVFEELSACIYMHLWQQP